MIASPCDAAILARQRDLFFVVRELWWLNQSSLEAYGASDALTIDGDGVRSGEERLAFVKNKLNLVAKHLRHLDARFWRLVASRASNASIHVDAYVDLSALSGAMKTGTRFYGREILFFQLLCNPQEVRVDNYILDRYGRTSRYDFTPRLTRLLVRAFDQAMPFMSRVERVAGLKTELYPFQQRSLARMADLEHRGVTFEEISRRYTCVSSRRHRVWVSKNDTLHATEECERTLIHFKGGFLTDDMGMGKTLTLLALCLHRPVRRCAASMTPGATLVVCPSHIISHWKKEIDKHTALRYAVVTVKDQIEKVTVKRIMSGEYDFVLVSFNMFCNPSFRSQMDYYSCAVGRKGRAFLNDFERQSPAEQESEHFVPHVFRWGRIIIDEFHELGNACYPNVAAYVSSLDSEATWFVSGTPVVNTSLFQGFLPDKILDEGTSADVPVNDVMIKLVQQSNVKNERYEDVVIPGLCEQVFKVELSRSERIIYDGIRSEGREQQLKVCSYAKLAKCLASETEVQTIDEMKDVVKSFLQHKAKGLEQSLAAHDRKVEQLRALVPDIDARTRESFALKQLLLTRDRSEKDLRDTRKTIEYVRNEEHTECVICLETMDFPCVIKTCGHKMCDTCLPVAMRTNKKCPVCRAQYDPADVIKVNSGCDDPLLRKYGSKLYNLFQLLSKTPEVKTLIFSQWDELLKDVGKCIAMFDPSKKALFCRGNIMQKKSTVEKFSTSKSYNLLLLSTLNAGSGCDLTMAKRVILLDTVDGSGDFITGLERQAIARCHRIGQQASVEVVRFVTKDTIEEELYERIRTNASGGGAAAAAAAAAS